MKTVDDGLHPQIDFPPWPNGNSVTARLIRKLDWISHDLGPCEKWPPLLRSSVDLVLSCHFPMVVLWGEKLFQIYNDGYLALMGTKHPAGLGQRTQECWPEVWHINEPIYERAKQGETLTFENQLFPIMRNGVSEDAFFTLCYSPIWGPAQAIVGVIVTVFETTAQVQASKERDRVELALRQTEERLRAAQDAAQLATWEWDLATGEFHWSGSVESVYGCPGEALQHVDCIMEHLHSSDRDIVVANIRRAIDHDGKFYQEFRVTWPDRSTHWVAGQGQTVPATAGASSRMVGISWNISARKEAEERLIAERARLIELFEQAPAFIAVVGGPDHVFEMVNSSYYELVGDRELMGRSVAEAIPETRSQGFIALLDEVYRTGRAHVASGSHISLSRTSGEPPEDRYLDLVYQPRREADGSVSGIIALGVDVTERRLAEQTLLQTEKLAAVGRLASSIAHEINNPLEAVTNLLYLASSSESLPPSLKGYLELAEIELRRVSNITNQTLRFHKQSTDPVPIFCQDLFKETLSIYQARFLNSGIQVEKRKRASQPVTCFEGEIRQVLGNLVGNAIDAMQSTGGRLLLRSRDATNWKTGKRGVVLTVADTGPGISPQLRKRIFEAFFTTKGASGTGLGLWVSCEIIKRHHGALTVHSGQREGHSGTVFSVFLPFEAAIR